VLDVRFSCAAKRQKFFLTMNICFRSVDVGLLAFRNCGMRCFNRKREIRFDFGTIGLRDLACRQLFLFREHLLLG